MRRFAADHLLGPHEFAFGDRSPLKLDLIGLDVTVGALPIGSATTIRTAGFFSFRSDAPAGGAPDLGLGGLVMRLAVNHIVELIGPDRVFRFCRHPAADSPGRRP